MPDHPHAQATYNLVPLRDGTFTVEVTIPDAQPAKVTGFDTMESAQAWIERHKANIATGTLKTPRASWGRGRAKSRDGFALNLGRRSSAPTWLATWLMRGAAG